MGGAVVLGIDTPIGLTIVRELGARGIAVHGIAGDDDAIGLYSRFLQRGYRRPATEHGTVALLNHIAATAGADTLLAVSENDIALINRNSEALRSFRCLVPAAERMALVLDKLSCVAAARRVGIDVPVTREVQHAGEIRRVASELTYPVVLKWRDPVVIAPQLARADLPLLKAEYCYDVEGLIAALGRYPTVGTFPLIQSYCPGYGLGQMIFMHGGEALLSFQHRRVHEWPPEGGFSTVCESVPLDQHTDLLEKSVQLLRAIEWEGAAMVEYRYDPQTRRALFMEINGRFWGSLPLAYHAGAHFAWYTYSVLGRGTVPTPAPYRSGVTCRFMVPETRRLLTILFRPQTIQNRSLRFNKAAEAWAFVAAFFRPGQRYYVFTWRDPWPCMMDLYFICRKAVRRIGRHLRVALRPTPSTDGSAAPRP